MLLVLDPDGIVRKRIRKTVNLDFLSDNYGILPPVKAEGGEAPSTNVLLKERIKAKATRKNKTKRKHTEL